MIPDDNLIEAINLNLHNNQERDQNRTYAVMANISAVDPTTNRIKAVVDTWTNDNQTYMESGWLQLTTPAAGNQYGIQILPFGGATTNDPKAQNQGNNGSQPPAEQVVLNVVGHKKALYLGGVQAFNTTNVPPSGYQDKSQIQANAGEWLFKHACGNYLYFANANLLKLISLTNPTPVLQTDQTPDDLSQDIVIGVQAVGVNSNTNGDEPKTVTANGELVSSSTGGQTSSTANLNLGATATSSDNENTQTVEANVNQNVTASTTQQSDEINATLTNSITATANDDQGTATAQANQTVSATDGETNNATTADTTTTT